MRVQGTALVVYSALEFVDLVRNSFFLLKLLGAANGLLALFDGLKLLAECADLLAQCLELGGDFRGKCDDLAVLSRGRLLAVGWLRGWRCARGESERRRDLLARDVVAADQTLDDVDGGVSPAGELHLD